MLVRGLIKELDLALAKEVRVWGYWPTELDVAVLVVVVIIDRGEGQKERKGC